jgi:hypothetical protein
VERALEWIFAPHARQQQQLQLNQQLFQQQQQQQQLFQQQQQQHSLRTPYIDIDIATCCRALL